MATNVLMPQLGESIAEGTIVRWNKELGEHVDRDEPLFEVSTDKVDAEVPSPVAGVVAELRVQAGETVAVDSVVAVIAAPGEEGTAASAEAAADRTTSLASSADRIVRPSQAARGGRDVRFSPVVRRLAREHGVDPAAVVGTGAGGRVTREDILAHVAARGTDAGQAAGERVEPLSVMRQQIARHMVASRRTSAHVHTVFDVDFTRVTKLLAAHADGFASGGIKLTYLSFVAKAVVDGLRAVPIVNAALSEDGVSVRYTSRIGLGIAVALDDGEGLVVPVVRDAGAKNVAELSQAIADLATRAREKKLTPDEVQGGTFTITNPGAFGSIAGMPIINQPQAAILCVGAVERRPVVLDDDTIAPRHRCYLTLGFDHRLIDGALADRFMSSVKQAIEQFDEAQL